MTVKSLGNHSKGYLGHGIGGHGIANNKQGLGWDCLVASAAGDVEYVELSSLVIGDINQGVFFQSEAGATIDFTLCNSALATDRDPQAQASVLWGNTLTVPNTKQIVTSPGLILFTVLRITFTQPGAVYIGVR
jgi:hypothetical protein